MRLLIQVSCILVLGLTGGVALAADLDGDGVQDLNDNCPMVANPGQNDSNFNHIGDVCEGDYDDDNIPDLTDNCWDLPNPDQADLDGDDVGNICDIDRDGDGMTNAFETSTLGTNPDNWDTDGDHVSDAYDCAKLDNTKALGDDCDTTQIIQNPVSNPTPTPDVSDPFADDDGDGVLNGDDNCPETFNPGQQDQDGDGLGDQCDNEFRIRPEVLFIRGGGGLGQGCSVVGTTPADGFSMIMILIGLPGLLIRRLRRK